MSANKQYTTFFLNNLFLGVEVLKVQEVIRYQQMTPVPLAPEMIEGLINLRGQIVTAIDRRRRFAFPALATERRPMNVVIRCEEGPVSLLVDEIGDVIEVDDETCEPPPDTVRGGARELITGVHQLKDRLLLILDTDRAINLPHPQNRLN